MNRRMVEKSAFSGTCSAVLEEFLIVEVVREAHPLMARFCMSHG